MLRARGKQPRPHPGAKRADESLNRPEGLARAKALLGTGRRLAGDTPEAAAILQDLADEVRDEKDRARRAARKRQRQARRRVRR